MHTVKREAGWERTGGSISDSRRKAALRNGNSPGFQKCRSSHDRGGGSDKRGGRAGRLPEDFRCGGYGGDCKKLGGTVWWERNALHLNCEKIEKSRVEGALSKRLRASLLFLGSLLARTGEAYLAGAGGCRIGKRPTDLHQRAMELLGAEVFEEDGTIRAKADHPKGAVLCFPKKSVGATENAVLFAVGAEGATRLEHCAREPEVVHLCRFLKAMGAEITGEGTEQITVYGRQGKRLLSGCRYRVPGDRIAAGTYLLMGAATRGHLTLSGAPLDEMGAVLSLYQKIGGQYTRKSGTLVADSKNVQHAVPYVETEEYPGFPTDLQSLYLAAAMTLEGKSCICENVFEDRLRTAEELQKMGGTLQICGKWLTAEKSRLHGAEVVSQDLRAARHSYRRRLPQKDFPQSGRQN